jgi:hypothetical protein
MLDVKNNIALFAMVHNLGPPDLLAQHLPLCNLLGYKGGFLATHHEGNPSLFWLICWMLLTEMLANPGTSPFNSMAVLNR